MGREVPSTVLLLLCSFTLRTLRVTLVKREAQKTVEYAAAFLGRASLCRLLQHLCFFYVGVASPNLPAAMPPIVMSKKTLVAMVTKIEVLRRTSNETDCFWTKK